MSRHALPHLAAVPSAEPLFRVWIAEFHDWRPSGPHDVPPQAKALEPADEQCMTALAAAAYVGSFNRAQLERTDNRWAVAVPISVRFDGEPVPGTIVVGANLPPVE